MSRTHIDTLAAAMRILACDIEGGDGTANAAILEAAERLEQLAADLRVALPVLQSALIDGRGTSAGRYVEPALARLVNEVAP